MCVSSFQTAVSFEVTIQDDDCIAMTLEPSDLRDNITAYAARISGEPRTHILPFQRTSDGQPAPAVLLYNTTYHGLCYTVGLVLANGSTWTKPVKTVTLLTSETAPWIRVTNLYPLFLVFFNSATKTLPPCSRQSLFHWRACRFQTTSRLRRPAWCSSCARRRETASAG